MSGRTLSLIAVVALSLTACSSTTGVSETSSRPNPATGAESDTDAGGTDPQQSSSGSEPSTGGDDLEPVAEFEPAPFEWDEYDDAVDVATIEVPIDYGDPNGPRFDLFVARYNALDPDRRIGSLLINPGGPGLGGSDYALFAAQVFDRALLERFDIIAWDPRGTGESEPAIDCIDDWDPYFNEIDSTPDDEAERALVIERAEVFARQCVGKNRSIIQHVGTNNSARDIDAIRRALGEDQISFFGFSYGSELGAAWATMYPDTVRAAVLDGARDPGADSSQLSIQQQIGFDAALTKFLAGCSDDDDCAFHNGGDSEAAFDALLAELDEAPIPGQPGRPPVNRDVAVAGVIEALYVDSFWPALAQALAAAQLGDGSGLLALSDSYFQRTPNLLEAFQTISCADTVERSTIEEVEALAAELAVVAPRLNAEGWLGFMCTFFPDSIDPLIAVTGAGAGPIVVIGTTGDPATPLESTITMSNTLEDGRLVIVEADQHTGYNVNRCVIEVVNDYLIDLEPPDDGTECR